MHPAVWAWLRAAWQMCQLFWTPPGSCCGGWMYPQHSCVLPQRWERMALTLVEQRAGGHPLGQSPCSYGQGSGWTLLGWCVASFTSPYTAPDGIQLGLPWAYTPSPLQCSAWFGPPPLPCSCATCLQGQLCQKLVVSAVPS